MKNIIGILILSFSSLFLFSNTSPQQESERVIAFSGLKLRSTPNMDGRVLVIVPFGEKVDIVERGDSLLTYEWMEGNWTKVSYQNIEGYVFDGYLTSLPVPTEDFELTQNDLDLAYPLLAWAEHNFDYVLEPDTIERADKIKLIQYLENDIVLSREENDYAFKSELELTNVRLGDAYNIVKSMLLTKREREVFEENSVFISNRQGEVDRIKINLSSPVEIKKIGSNRVKITVISFHEGCGL